MHVVEALHNAVVVIESGPANPHRCKLKTTESSNGSTMHAGESCHVGMLHAALRRGHARSVEMKVPGSMLTHVEDQNVDPAHQHKAQVRYDGEQCCVCLSMQLVI